MVQDYLKATQESSSGLADFFQTVLQLKTIPRQGWKDKLGMDDPESVADHCYSTTVMAMVLSDSKKLDTIKTVKMSLLHDLAETVTGDLTPEQTTKSKKIVAENMAMKKIFSTLDEPQKSEYWKIWREYLQNKSKEAKLVHQIDKLEMAIQASQYEKLGFSKSQIMPFLTSAKNGITDPRLRKILSKFM